jgi:hypothetical protein
MFKKCCTKFQFCRKEEVLVETKNKPISKFVDIKKIIFFLQVFEKKLDYFFKLAIFCFIAHVFFAG